MSSPPVSPTSQTAAEDIRDIRGPVAISSPWTLAVLLALAAAVLFAALLLLWRRWRKPAPALPPPLPHEVALAGLDAARRLMDPSRARAFAACVSDVIRQYIDARFGQSAPRRTTEEFLRGLVDQPLAELAPHVSSLEELLRQSDLVKFARFPLATDNMEEMLSTARRFVEETRGPRNDPATRAAAVP